SAHLDSRSWGVAEVGAAFVARHCIVRGERRHSVRSRCMRNKTMCARDALALPRLRSEVRAGVARCKRGFRRLQKNLVRARARTAVRAR
ncbi:hypothetical protein JTP67_34095, partial [Streptomyces sp. S12]|nr:hypothetical protein [Streptomyces sp. S12]